jgi:hypothetical protein
MTVMRPTSRAPTTLPGHRLGIPAPSAGQPVRRVWQKEHPAPKQEGGKDRDGEQGSKRKGQVVLGARHNSAQREKGVD